MTDLINTIFERLNSPKPIFDEKVTKTNLIPVVEELNDDDLENIVYEITNADYFDDMTWILYSTNLDKKYPKTLHFLETIFENIKKEYVFGELSDLYESLQTKLMKTFLSSPGRTNYDKYTRFTYYLKHHEDADQVEIIILNGALIFKNNDVLTIPESAIADFRALGITSALRFKHGHWVPDSIAKAVSMNLYVDQLKELKTMVNETAPASNKTALDNLLDGNYQITSFAHDKDQPIYVTWQTTNNDENINKNQSITKEKTPNGEVLQITIVSENA